MNVSRLLVAVALTVAPALPASTAAAQVRPQGYLTPEILAADFPSTPAARSQRRRHTK